MASSPRAQIHVAEGLAVRESIATALRELGVTVTAVDQRTVYEHAAQALRLSQKAIQAALQAARPEDSSPWRQEQKLAALAAWSATGARVRAAVTVGPRAKA
jgi:hypothetical protein